VRSKSARRSVAIASSQSPRASGDTGRERTAPASALLARVSAAASSDASPNRSAGSAAMQRRMMRSTLSGTAARTARIAGGASVKRRASIACGLVPANGSAPASISYSMHPRAYTSLRPSTFWSPDACSGLM
jgi:hypothetical protein